MKTLRWVVCFLTGVWFLSLPPAGTAAPPPAGTAAPPQALAREEPSAVFQKANDAYRAGEYAQAASLYQSLISRGWRNESVFYNLGNADFKQEHLGAAILNYERARRLAPHDRDIRANLEFAQGALEYRIEDKRNWYQRTAEKFLASFKQEEIGILALGFGLLFWLIWMIPLYFKSEDRWGWKRKTFLVLTLCFASLWVLKGVHDLRIQEAIVLKDQAALRYGPSYKDRVAFRLGQGLKVRVKAGSGEWSRVTLTNGETGWMSREEIEAI